MNKCCKARENELKAITKNVIFDGKTHFRSILCFDALNACLYEYS